jgi:phosphoribosylglycinamide formyltransferase 1
MSAVEAAPKLAVLASGEGTNLQAMLDAVTRGDLPGRIALVISDRAEAGALARARAAGIEAEWLDPAEFPSRQACDEALAARLEHADISLVVLAGFMRILDPAVVQRFAGRMLNVHPSLLPRHRGLHTHRRVLEAGDHQHGATVHFVTPALDAGPGVLQFRMAVHSWDTPTSLAARVRAGEHVVYPLAVRWWLTGRLAWQNGAATFDGQPLHTPLVLTRDGIERAG